MKNIFLILLVLSLVMCSSKQKTSENINSSAMLKLKKEILTIKSIDSFNSSKVHVIKALNNRQKTFKIVSVKSDDRKSEENYKRIKINETYSFELYSVFTGISLGTPLKTYTVYNVEVSIEPENSIEDLFNTPDLDGLCLIKNNVLEENLYNRRTRCAKS